MSVPDHYKTYQCKECGAKTLTVPRVEDTYVGVTCMACGEHIEGGGKHQ